MYSGYYPLGAQYDPVAPYNQPEPHMVKCEACNGKGRHYFAYNFYTNEETECTENTWCCLPETEDVAGTGLYIRGQKETCEVCDGVGVVEDDDDYEPDYDDD